MAWIFAISTEGVVRPREGTLILILLIIGISIALEALESSTTASTVESSSAAVIGIEIGALIIGVAVGSLVCAAFVSFLTATIKFDFLMLSELSSGDDGRFWRRVG